MGLHVELHRLLLDYREDRRLRRVFRRLAGGAVTEGRRLAPTDYGNSGAPLDTCIWVELLGKVRRPAAPVRMHLGSVTDLPAQHRTHTTQNAQQFHSTTRRAGAELSGHPLREAIEIQR